MGLNYYLKILNETNSFTNSNNFELGGSFTLVDQENKVFSSSNLKKLKLIYFGYTFCPDVCPFDLLKISKLFEKNKYLIKNIQPIFITVDPKRDTSSIIKSFLDNFDTNIIGLTGEDFQIKAVLKKFKIYNKKNYNSELADSTDNYLIDHSVLFYLLDQNDKYLTHFTASNFQQDFLRFINQRNLVN